VATVNSIQVAYSSESGDTSATPLQLSLSLERATWPSWPKEVGFRRGQSYHRQEKGGKLKYDRYRLHHSGMSRWPHRGHPCRPSRATRWQPLRRSRTPHGRRLRQATRSRGRAKWCRRRAFAFTALAGTVSIDVKRSPRAWYWLAVLRGANLYRPIRDDCCRLYPAQPR
jgi:hypothetical protein